MKAKHQRLIFVVASVVLLCAAVLLSLRAFSENLVFFYSPADLPGKTISANQKIRIGGLIDHGSIIRHGGDRISFTVSDGKASLQVDYQGLLPNLFREGQGAIAEGYLRSPNLFAAERILTKHDENYMPREVADSLKKTGHWKPEGGGYER
ncbi:MAG: cytochrome c maturation protein CcmE [Alphaproteobacteria bacterium]|nr:cytochrome c maturation protein CcmE [Alphaproteobacteria bacterium]